MHKYIKKNMGKSFIICLVFILLYLPNYAQVKPLSCKLEWKPNEKVFLDTVESFTRMNFVDATYNLENNLPHKVVRVFIENNNIQSAKINDIVVEDIPVEKLIDIKDLAFIGSDFKLKIENSCVRKQRYAYVDVLPLRKNSKTGKIQRLISYSVNFETQPYSEARVERVYADESKMSSGEWYKIRVSKTGVYELSYSIVQSMGFDSPEDVGVFGYGGMVSKLNSTERYDDLPERPVLLQDNNSNGVFDSGDALIVYLEGPNSFDYSSDHFQHNIHNYSDYSYYFLSDQSESRRILTKDGDANPNVFTSSYDYYMSLEKDSINLIGSGRTLYWRHFDYYLSYNFNFDIPDVISSETGFIFTHLAARSSVNSRFKNTINGVSYYSKYIKNVGGASTDAYAIDSFDTINTSFSNSNILNVKYLPPVSGSEAWLDYIIVNARANLRLSSNYLLFRNGQSIGDGNITQYTLSNTNSSTQIWDVTDPANIFEINPDEQSGSSLKFTAASDNLREFVAVNPNSSFPSPEIDGSELLGFVDNQNLHASSQVDYIIVSHPDFEEYAEQLASMHESVDGLTSLVVTPQEIYNEFSSGTPDVSAIRDFVKMFYDRANSESQMPKYLLLFGDASYDNKTIGSSNTNYILSYQSVGSLNPTASFVSDDFFVLLDEDEGTVNGREGLDVGVGRIPVKSQSEAEAVLAKIFSYYSPKSFGAWRNIICFVGDDAEDTTTHEIQTNNMGDTVMKNQPVYNVDKIFLDAYNQISTVQGDRYPEVNQEIDERVGNGALIINYTGHGNEKTLAHEAVVTLSQINNWDNSDRLPVFVTATCEFSRFDDFELTSAGEQILLNPDGGGVALFTTSRMVYSGENAKLNTEFYRQLFNENETEPYALGEVIMHAKNIASTNPNKRNFSLLGDPALHLAIPNYLVETDSINNQFVEVYQDTIHAANLVRVTGHIADMGGSIKDDFNGVIYPTVYDKVMDYITLGNDDNPAMPFKERNNVLYSGKSSVENGYFEFEFIVPVDIAYFFDNGKISYYAQSDTKDAHGYFDDFCIGGSSEDLLTDNEGPVVELFMNNDAFIDGGITDENPLMLATVSDESGINTVGNGIGHDIIAILDDNTIDAIVLNDFYESDLDSYQSGVVNYPFSDLETGMHTLRIKVWDVFNNSSEDEINFIVANSSELVIDQLYNYPNPMVDYTYFTFTHNHDNEELDIEIKIFNMNGQLIKVLNEAVFSTGYSIVPIRWSADKDTGGKVEPGMYVYRVEVASSNGDVVNKFEKLVVVK